MIDFKEIKNVVKAAVIEKLDHKSVLSRNFLSKNPLFSSEEKPVYLGSRTNCRKPATVYNANPL